MYNMNVRIFFSDYTVVPALLVTKAILSPVKCVGRFLKVN